MPSYEEIQAGYIAELRALQPSLMEWWKQLSGIQNINDAADRDVANRWPTAFSGHPRVIATFRKYFMQVDDLNYENEVNYAEPRPPGNSEFLWGSEEGSPAFPYVPPNVLLIDQIKELAPDIHKLVAGIVFVPVGLNQFDEAV